MGLYLRECRETRVGFISGYFCGILPEIKELRNELNIGSPKKENIEDKVREQEKGMIKEPYINILHSIERKIKNYRW